MLIFILRTWQTVSFHTNFPLKIPQQHWRIARQSEDSLSKAYYLIRLRRHVSILPRRTILTPSSLIVLAWIIKNEINRKKSADRWMWRRYPFENYFLVKLRRRLPVTRITMFWYKPRGYQARRKVYTLVAYTFFPHWDSAIHVFAHKCACPDKAAQVYFGRVVPKPVLGMIEFPPNCTNYDRTSNMHRLVRIFPL